MLRVCSLSILRGNSPAGAAVSLNTVPVLRVNCFAVSVYSQYVLFKTRFESSAWPCNCMALNPNTLYRPFLHPPPTLPLTQGGAQPPACKRGRAALHNTETQPEPGTRKLAHVQKRHPCYPKTGTGTPQAHIWASVSYMQSPRSTEMHPDFSPHTNTQPHGVK